VYLTLPQNTHHVLLLLATARFGVDMVIVVPVE
jgi:hypothetical protein